jgi:hypothetical protein
MVFTDRRILASITAGNVPGAGQVTGLNGFPHGRAGSLPASSAERIVRVQPSRRRRAKSATGYPPDIRQR